ncbi:thermostable hemolysin [Pseudoxanthomonas dokdonensis]|uniref:Thermostable hemolysin n=1 Tax=Pseudoxanthomonas dokdonensis TaxID=344882 RepID=A0A0R0CQD2_9GAMM|nr:thermostable hemolysin [Pseudoxanthomonas dokdonensis]
MWVNPSHPLRSEVEALIAQVYRDRYGAQLRHFLPHLLAFRDATGRLSAAIGLRCGSEGQLFTEQYLQGPAEQTIAEHAGRIVAREQVVEVGNFAALGAGDARQVIILLTSMLHRAGFRWVLFTATRNLRNAFDRLHLQTVELAAARQECLQSDDSDWGSYYDTQPRLMMGDIAAGHAYLARINHAGADRVPLMACMGGALA